MINTTTASTATAGENVPNLPLSVRKEQARSNSFAIDSIAKENGWKKTMVQVSLRKNGESRIGIPHCSRLHGKYVCCP